VKKVNIRWQLVVYDFLILLAAEFLLLYVYHGFNDLTLQGMFAQTGLTFLCIFTMRLVWGIYQQVWRYGGIQCYILLLLSDGCGFFINAILELTLPMEQIVLPRLLAIVCMNLLGALAIRMLYRYAYKRAGSSTFCDRVLTALLRLFAGKQVLGESRRDVRRIRMAIVGAGRVGVSLAEELLANDSSAYQPRCFIDVDEKKVGRTIHGLAVLPENDTTLRQLKDLDIQEVVFALPNLRDDDRKQLYTFYTQAGYKVKVYDFPTMQTAGAKRHLREFDVEDLLFRKSVVMQDEKTAHYYAGKVILIPGGGGSIGSELARQLAAMNPKQIILLDIYENGAYDVQQELRIAYGDKLDLRLEIGSICSRSCMERIFQEYRPQIIIHAAAHKHVPLMEHNVIEAVENNIFGTALLIELSEKYGAQRFMMVSTDKAVNPTNVMGATKRMCEMLVQSAATAGRVTYSATRFGNVLGSAGSVIPLFKKQIASGGPITITDKRIIRYFMTIPEASQLVLQSGAMARNGELFVLDMGQPVKILDLAESMIRLAGASNISIVETGLRPGEKLYEELLIRTEELDRTANSLIFIERDMPLPPREIQERLALLRQACDSGDREQTREALRRAVPTYRTPESVNAQFRPWTEPTLNLQTSTAGK